MIKINIFTYLRNFPAVRYFYGDGYQGLPTYAPFDRIIVTAAAPAIPDKLAGTVKTRRDNGHSCWGGKSSANDKNS